ncbi:MAG: phosphoribosyltransferase [Flavobacteriales bacterium]|nr:phosphoribosyltransferase [Flavobacteriales bacterium]
MTTASERILILGKEDIDLKIQRIAHQIHEIYHEENELILVGIEGRGFEFAQRLMKFISKFNSFEAKLVKIHIDKDAPHSTILNKEFEAYSFKNKSVLLVDDVLNSGRTLTYAVAFILKDSVKTLKTAILVNREHHSFPITADFVGLSLATTMKEHITVDFGGTSEGVYLL